jgi:hypothetical protein
VSASGNLAVPETNRVSWPVAYETRCDMIECSVTDKLSKIQSGCCVATAILTLWLSGFGCVTCCAVGFAEPGCNAVKSTCNRSGGSRDCCKRAESCSTANPTIGRSLSKPRESGCPLLPKQMVSLLRQSTPVSLAADVAPAHPFLTESIADREAGALSGVALPANRGSTRLRCSVLLI